MSELRSFEAALLRPGRDPRGYVLTDTRPLAVPDRAEPIHVYRIRVTVLAGLNHAKAPSGS